MPHFKHIEPSSIAAEHPVAQFYANWCEMDRLGELTPWSVFSPMQMPRILPWMLLLEKQAEEKYYYRVCGSSCEQLFGQSYQGKYLGDGLPDDAARIRLREFKQVEDSGQPLFSEANLPISGKEFIEVYRGTFGFSQAGEFVDRILVVIAPKQSR